MSWITPYQSNVFETKVNWKETDVINFNDFNRIESNMVEVANYLRSITYNIPDLTIKTDRDNKSIDYLSSINRIENNLEILKDNFETPLEWQATKTWLVGIGFTYEDVNRIENNIARLMSIGVITYKNFRNCGTMACGEGGLIY